MAKNLESVLQKSFRTVSAASFSFLWSRLWALILYIPVVLNYKLMSTEIYRQA